MENISIPGRDNFSVYDNKTLASMSNEVAFEYYILMVSNGVMLGILWGLIFYIWRKK